MISPSYSPPRKYFPELDGVRAVAAIMVILFHLSQMGVRIPGPASFGETGVDLFFVLSGFLITGILLKARERDWEEVRTFYIRRSLRIFPLYYAYIIVASALGASIAGWNWVYLQNVPFAFGAPMGNIGHFWSLAVEEQFYFVWPFVVMFLPRRWLQATLWSMLAVTFLCRFALVEFTHIEVYYLTITRLDGLAAGAILALHHSRGTLARHRNKMMVLAVISFVLVGWEGLRFRGAALPFVQITKFSLFACFYASFVGLLLTSKRNALTTVFASRPMRWLGRISYGLYVFHPQMLRLCFGYLHAYSALVRACAGLSATLAITSLSWYAFERPLLRLKDRIAPEIGSPPDVRDEIGEAVPQSG